MFASGREQRVASNKRNKLHARAENVAAIPIEPSNQFAVLIEDWFHGVLPNDLTWK